jgi:hypothetical protein
MAWNMVLQCLYRDMTLPVYHFTFLITQYYKVKNVNFKWLICKYFYTQAPYYKPEMYNLSSTSCDQIRDKYNTSNEQRKLHAISVARNGKKRALRVCSNTSMSSAAVTRCPVDCRLPMR